MTVVSILFIQLLAGCLVELYLGLFEQMTFWLVIKISLGFVTVNVIVTQSYQLFILHFTVVIGIPITISTF